MRETRRPEEKAITKISVFIVRTVLGTGLVPFQERFGGMLCHWYCWLRIERRHAKYSTCCR